jgi:FkbM family methyltransferase
VTTATFGFVLVALRRLHHQLLSTTDRRKHVSCDPRTDQKRMKLTLPVQMGEVIMSSSLRRPDGGPRFTIAFPTELSEDKGAQHLLFDDALPGGYEPPTQSLIEKTLRAGDLFIDIGAHWGFYTLQAATHAGDIRVLAIEPHPTNASILFRNVIRNGVQHLASVISVACGDAPAIEPLVTNSSMGHSIRGIGVKPSLARGPAVWVPDVGPAVWVPVVTLDAVLANVSFAGRRLIIKIDAEGFEPQVVAGARAVLASGRCDLVIWECGHSPQGEIASTVETLSTWGFRHLRPPSERSDGPLVPYDEGFVGNVFSTRQLV